MEDLQLSIGRLQNGIADKQIHWRPILELANSKDGFAIAYYKDIQAKRVLEFLIPIFYLEKPTQVMVVVGNTIFGALLGIDRWIGVESSTQS